MEYALDVRVKNAAILKALKERGWNQVQLAEAARVTPTELSAWATLRRSPWIRETSRHNSRVSGIYPAALRLAVYLGIPPEECFPRELYSHFEDKETRALVFAELDSLPIGKEVRQLQAHEDQECDYIARELASRRLSALEPRARSIVEDHFGLGPDGELTMAEIGSKHDLSRGRIAQIVSASIRLMREARPSRRMDAMRAKSS
jgi:transcriptional regulator with XRE-family HTH domain